MNREIVIHIGFSKTGTTTLQTHLFSGHSQLDYLGKPYRSEVFKEELYHLLKDDSTVYNPQKLKKYMADYLANEGEKNTAAGKKTILISDEILLSYSKVRDKGVVAQRLKEVFNPKIIITIRSQYEILKAAYLSRGRLLLNVPERYEGLHVSFWEWMELSAQNVDRSYLGHIDFYKTIEYYINLFGRDRVCILMLEEFVKDRRGYLKKLTDFLNIDLEEAMKLTEGKHEHKPIAQWQLDFERFRGRFYRLRRLPVIFSLAKALYILKGKLQRNKPAKVRLPLYWEDYIRHMYLYGNERLKCNLGLPLLEYGYPY